MKMMAFGRSLSYSRVRIHAEDEARAILLNILRDGVLRIRMFGWNGLADRCALEADHIHNLPDLIRDMKLELLRYYYNVERPEFMKACPDTETFEADWKRLKAILGRNDLKP